MGSEPIRYHKKGKATFDELQNQVGELRYRPTGAFAAQGPE